MVLPAQASTHNRLLAALSHDDLARLQPHLEPVTLKMRDVIVEPNTPIAHVYFIEQGIASVIAISPKGERIEVGPVGREGMSGHVVIQDLDRSLNQTLIQVGGSALRMPRAELQSAMDESVSIRSLLLRYTYSASVLVDHTALANGRYGLNERLARWLLMCHDRLDGDDLPITHEFIGLMMGVRRAGMTDALHLLEGVHIIKAIRGHITVRDRIRLEEVAGDCYGAPEAEYARMIGRRADAPRSSMA